MALSRSISVHRIVLEKDGEHFGMKVTYLHRITGDNKGDILEEREKYYPRTATGVDNQGESASENTFLNEVFDTIED